MQFSFPFFSFLLLLSFHPINLILDFRPKMLVKLTSIILVSFLVNSSVSANKKNCEKACTTEYDPICAQSKTGEHKEFSNTCIFEIAVCSEPYLHWQEVNKGPCDSNQNTEPFAL